VFQTVLRLAVALVVSSSCFAAADTPARTHDITLDDYLTVHPLTACATSPDGKYVAYTELRWGEHDEPRQSDLWIVETATKQATRLTFERANDSSPQWAADGKHLYFLSKRTRGEKDKKPPYDGTAQVWITGLHPGEPLAITRVKGGIESYQVSQDGRTLYYTKAGEEAEREWKSLRKKYGDIQFGSGAFKYTELWKLDLQTWREERLAAPERVITEFRVAPDESRVAMVTTPDDRLITREGQSRVDVFDMQTRQTITLPDKLYRADAPTPYGWLENPAWSPDAKALAWTVGFDGYQTEVLVAEFGAGDPAVWMLKRPDEVSVAGGLEWRPGGGELCFLAEKRARKHIHAVSDVRAGKQGAARVLTSGDVVVFDYSFSADGQQVGFIQGNPQDPGNIFWAATAQTGPAVRLTNANPQVDTWKLPQMSLVQWKAPDGVEVEGVLELPPDYKPGDPPLPLAVEVHGGPSDATLLYLQYWIYGRVAFPARGYALLCPNYRGSTGYGDKFLTDLVGRENDIEVKDILAGVDALIERGVADPNRLGVLGWSNGGFLVNCLITTTQRFKAASSGAGVFDQLMQWGLEDTPGHVINFMRGLPWERQEAYLKASPAYKLGSCTTPTVIHIGENDERVPAAHARALYRGLKEYTQTPTVLLVYPGAGHGLSISDHRKGKLDWDLAWFDKYVLGKSGE
jgi:dipeptidyl aminopeptidase/acylaminoacyl peptidase